jgi:hypothetical protein
MAIACRGSTARALPLHKIRAAASRAPGVPATAAGGTTDKGYRWAGDFAVMAADALVNRIDVGKK